MSAEHVANDNADMLRKRILLLLAAVALAALQVPASSDPAAPLLPLRFTDELVLEGLTLPTSFAFAPDGRVFVAEKSGIVKVYENLEDDSAQVFADLSDHVYSDWDRGLLSLALPRDFSAAPFVYVAYTFDAPVGADAPYWNDGCPDPPGATKDGCPVTGRLARLIVNEDGSFGGQQVLLRDWCQQFSGHSIGDLLFGRDGSLYMSAGDGASFTFADYGQRGVPDANPCGDPAGGTDVPRPPRAEGGALRSQDLQTSGDPVGLSGTVIRVDPDTGKALPDNPLFHRPRRNARRIVAYGLRNPFRMALRPKTGEVFVGENGWNRFDEINRLADPTGPPVENFGWPCYEGRMRQIAYDATDLSICERLYVSERRPALPFVSYEHKVPVMEGDTCSLQGGSPSGLAFYPRDRGSYPASYDGALFWADYARRCIYVLPETGGRLDRSRVKVFRREADWPVDLQIGPGGDLYYVSIATGSLHGIRYETGNLAPTPELVADKTSGPVPLEVSFDASGSQDPDGDELTYDWDLDGDGVFGDSHDPRPDFTYTDSSSNVEVTVRVSDGSETRTESIVLTPGNESPEVEIVAPAPGFLWTSNSSFHVEAQASDGEDGSLPASTFEWSVWVNHCDGRFGCHRHPRTPFTGVEGIDVDAPDHEHPASIGVRVTVTDARGASDTDRMIFRPETVELTFRSRPPGMKLVANWRKARAPVTRTAIVGSTFSISAPSPQVTSDGRYAFDSWSDGGAATRAFTVTGQQPARVARFEARRGS